MDPLGEQFSYQPSFVYADNNPIRFIDYMGMNADGYTMNENGELSEKPVNNEGGGNYDVIYAKKKYSEDTKKDYDETGNKAGIKVSKDIIKSGKEAKMPVLDNETGEPTKEVLTNNRYEVKTDKEALNLMNFLDKNTNVEWSNTFMKDNKGASVNLLMTSHEKSTISGSSYITLKYEQKSFNVIRHDHIHPNGNPNPSQWNGDWDFGSMFLKSSPNAKFRILANGKYYPYTIPLRP